MMPSAVAETPPVPEGHLNELEVDRRAVHTNCVRDDILKIERIGFWN
jgi:hypothetical protein